MRTTIFFLPLLSLYLGCQEQEVPPTPETQEPLVDQRVGDEQTGDLSIPSEPLLIREATISVNVQDSDHALSEITKITNFSEGFVASSADRLGRDGNNRSAQVVLRVPAHRFDAVIGQIRELAEVVEEQNLTVTDVTEEYVDLEARLQVKGALEGRFLELLHQATSTTEALEIERSLATVREEIERLEGRRQYLSRRVELSTITVNVHESTSAVSRLSHALAIGGEVSLYLGYAAIVLVTGFSPFLLALTLLLLGAKMMVRWRRRRSA